MPEFIKTAEVIGNVAQSAYNLGKFVVERFIPGGWAGLAGDEASRELIRRNEDNLTRGEN